jgi:mRNA-degrading endonuclease toxin of MazEF toxin-antitoxin module
MSFSGKSSTPLLGTYFKNHWDFAKKGHSQLRVTCRFQGKSGQILLDQLRTVDKARLVRRLGQISLPAQRAVLATLSEIFSE